MICGSLKALILGLTILDVCAGSNAFRTANVPRSVSRPQGDPNGLSNSKYPALNGTTLEPVHFKQFNSKRRILRYGPYKAPPFSTDNGMKEFQEMDAEKPCVDCMIIHYKAGLEYPNGSYANSNSGMWLHHVVLYDFVRKDVVCPDLPYRFFASGNERTPVDLTLQETSQTGFPMFANSTMGLTLMLMNEMYEERDAVLTVEFEYIPDFRKEFKPLDAIWLDITGVCGDSDAKIPANMTVFEYHTPDIKMNTTGRIVAAGGHVHDGGSMVRFTKNKQTLCDFTAYYGESNGYIGGAAEHGGIQSPGNAPAATKGSSWTHISSMPLCYYVGTYKPGDELGIIAYYNISKHEAMGGLKGGLEPVMGIAIAWLQNDPESGPLALPAPAAPPPPQNPSSVLPSVPASIPTAKSPLTNTPTASISPSTASVTEISPHSENVPQTTSPTGIAQTTGTSHSPVSVTTPPAEVTASPAEISTLPAEATSLPPTTVTELPPQSENTPQSPHPTETSTEESTVATGTTHSTPPDEVTPSTQKPPTKPPIPVVATSSTTLSKSTTPGKTTTNYGLMTIMTINPGGTTVMTIIPVARRPTPTSNPLVAPPYSFNFTPRPLSLGGLSSYRFPKGFTTTRTGRPLRGFPTPTFKGIPKALCPVGAKCVWQDIGNDAKRQTVSEPAATMEAVQGVEEGSIGPDDNRPVWG